MAQKLLLIAAICAISAYHFDTHAAAAPVATCTTTVSLDEAVAILRTKPRTGFARKGIPDPETVWQHSLKVAGAARILFLARLPQLREYAATMARYHDIAEYEAPDYTPDDKIDPSVKRREEEAAFCKIIFVTEKEKTVRESWYEYENAQTVTARLVKDLDKIDAGVQAMVYGNAGYDTSDFFPNVERIIKDSQLKLIFRQLLQRYRSGLLTDPYAEYHNLLSESICPMIFQSPAAKPRGLGGPLVN